MGHGTAGRLVPTCGLMTVCVHELFSLQAAEEVAEAEGTAAAAEHVEELRAQLQLAETNARDLESEDEAQVIASELDMLRQAGPSPLG